FGFSAQRFRKQSRQSARARFVGSVEQEEAGVGRRAQGALDLRPVRLHLVPPPRLANSATRVTIWSAISFDSRSRAVCSAATVAYSEPTASIPESEPAVASTSTVPFAASTSR